MAVYKDRGDTSRTSGAARHSRSGRSHRRYRRYRTARTFRCTRCNRSSRCSGRSRASRSARSIERPDSGPLQLSSKQHGHSDHRSRCLHSDTGFFAKNSRTIRRLLRDRSDGGQLSLRRVHRFWHDFQCTLVVSLRVSGRHEPWITLTGIHFFAADELECISSSAIGSSDIAGRDYHRACSVRGRGVQLRWVQCAVNGNLDCIESYEYGATVWLLYKCGAPLNQLDLAVLKFRYCLLVLEGEAEEHEGCLGPDCSCFKEKG